MTTIAAPTRVTPEDLERLPNAKDFELVNGILVERQMGLESSAVALAIGAILMSFVKPRKLGHLFTTDSGFRCFPSDRNKVRRADVSFIARGRLPGDAVPLGYSEVAPDLVVEVLSPGDIAYEVDEKIAEYLGAGVKLVWVVNPRTKVVRIHRPASSPNGPIDVAAEDDVISGEQVLPGFECKVSEFFDI